MFNLNITVETLNQRVSIALMLFIYCKVRQLANKKKILRWLRLSRPALWSLLKNSGLDGHGLSVCWNPDCQTFTFRCHWSLKRKQQKYSTDEDWVIEKRACVEQFMTVVIGHGIPESGKILWPLLECSQLAMQSLKGFSRYSREYHLPFHV